MNHSALLNIGSINSFKNLRSSPWTQDVENLALMLSRASKKVTELQKKLPAMQQKLSQTRHSDESKEKTRIEKFEKEIPENLDNAWKRCRKVTGTLVTLKRLASVQVTCIIIRHGKIDKNPKTPILCDLPFFKNSLVRRWLYFFKKIGHLIPNLVYINPCKKSTCYLFTSF